jgi:glutamine amidotransferase
MDGRLFAHHGALADMSKLEKHLGDAAALLRGHSDSERLFAFITQNIRAHRGDVTAGLTSAIRWIADNLAFDSLNCLLATPNELWALRYPDTHPFYVLEREPGGRHGERELHYVSGSTRVHAPELASSASVVFASELLDDHPDWCALSAGELLHVARDLTVTSRIILDGASDFPPRSGLSGRAVEPNAPN